ncbi:phytanoyl-CoA dioxygenase family protein [Kiritimatiellota bacterium B12222]|nr:phytanoyl-CoA dioxygenase family protein [Kiritimatiellota bacterium B12222]
MNATNDRTFPPIQPSAEALQGPAFSKPVAPELQFPLSQEQLDFFWTNGYVALPGLFTPEEAQSFQSAAEEIYRSERVDPDNHRYDFATNNRDEEMLWKLDPFFDLHDVFRQAVFDRRIMDALASIYGGREPRLFKDKLICKPPHTHGNPLHQDYNWWQGYPTSLISVTVSVDAATEENGCTVIYPRDPRKGFCGELGSFKNEEAWKNDPSFHPDNAVKNIAQPGDVLLFHCFTPHEAGANTTDGLRRQMFLTYNDSIDGEFYFSHGEHYRGYIDAGAKAAGRKMKKYFL